MIIDDLKDSLKPSVNLVSHSLLNHHGLGIFMARLDCIVPMASGNKIYKLVGNLDKALQQGRKSLLSFGGAYSNHIHALALTAEKYDFKSIGIIRGEEVVSNPTLDDARAAGMLIVPVDRLTYRKRHDADYLAELQRDYPDAFIIPEGGANEDSLLGCGLIPAFIESAIGSIPHTICCAAGTGATAAGIASKLSEMQGLRVYSVVKDASIAQRMAELSSKCHLGDLELTDASYGGYAKFDKEHLTFILDWLQQTNVLLDPIYTSKLCRKVTEQLNAGDFPKGQSIVLLHSGGLQGWRGFQRKVEKLAGESAWRTIASFL